MKRSLTATLERYWSGIGVVPQNVTLTNCTSLYSFNYRWLVATRQRVISKAGRLTLEKSISAVINDNITYDMAATQYGVSQSTLERYIKK